MEVWLQVIVAVITSVLASSGIWTLVLKHLEKHNSRDEMLLGLGHDRIISLGMEYITRGYITNDEYENLHDYLYEPYEKMGGNGSATRIMEEVKHLPIRDK